VLRSAGSSQLSQTNQTRAAVANDGLTSGSHGFMREDRYFLATFDGDGVGLWPGAADDATWTIAPVVRESDGLLITLSEGVTPWTISMVVPKSRPTFTSRNSTLLSALTTPTCSP
jgi:hypothetical protein